MIRVLHTFGKLDRGGAEMRTVELMPLLAEKGVRFSFCPLASGEGQLDEIIRKLGGEVIPCPLRPGVWSFGQRFVKLLKQSNYDIVHSHGHNFSGNIVRLAHKAGIKGRIVHFRSMGDGKRITLKRKLYHYITRRMTDKHATAILAVGRGAMEYGWKQDWETDHRCQVIYNGLDLTAFDRTVVDRKGVRLELGIPDDSVLVINVGRLNVAKAHDVLLDAAAKVIAARPGLHFLLVGDGVLRVELEAKAKALNIASRVHFLGVRQDVPRLLKASDCFALSSRREGLPGAVLEAVAADLTVVATDLPGVREIAAHTNLINTIPVEDSNALANAILKTCENSRAPDSQRQTFPEEFSLQRCADKLYGIYLRQVEE